MTTGTPPNPLGIGPVDGVWLTALSQGRNLAAISGLVAHAGGTKAAALQISDQYAIVGFGTVATNGDSALLPPALKGTRIRVYNAGAATMSLYGRGTDTINGVATATAYSLTTTQAADFTCDTDGAWSAVKTA